MAGHRIRAMRQQRERNTRVPPPEPPRPWWRKPTNWIVTVLAAGITSALIPAISAMVAGGGHQLSDVTGLTPQRLPLSWTVSHTSAGLDGCHSWTIPKPLAAIGYHDFTADSPADEELWALGQGGIDDGAGAIVLTVQGTSDEDVIIRDLRVKVLSRAPAVHGVTITAGTGCGGGVTVRYYSVDVSAAKPRLELQGAHAANAVPIDQEYTVSQSDPEVFFILANVKSPQAREYTYEFQLDWSQGSTSGTVNLRSSAGKPFAVNGTWGKPEYLPFDGKWVDSLKIP